MRDLSSFRCTAGLMLALGCSSAGTNTTATGGTSGAAPSNGGSGGTAATTGGSTATGGNSAGSTAANSAGGSHVGSVTAADSIAVKCRARFDNGEMTCPTGRDPSPSVMSCEQQYDIDGPIGCREAWDAVVVCDANAAICDPNARAACVQCAPVGCDTQSNALLDCENQFTQRTGCKRDVSSDGQWCGSTTPYGFNCTGALPAGCTRVMDPAARNVSCCPDLSQ